MLEEEQRPEKNKRRKIGTVQNLKTAVTARLHSKPRNEGQEYVELWSLKVNRARWARAAEQAHEKLEDIDRALSKLKLPEQAASSQGPGERRSAKTVYLNRTIDFKSCEERVPHA
jgi:hypothetical protein